MERALGIEVRRTIPRAGLLSTERRAYVQVRRNLKLSLIREANPTRVFVAGEGVDGKTE